MKLNHKNTDNSKEIINGLKSLNQSENPENLNYFHPNIHRIKHQIRWFKGSRDRGFKSDKAA